VQDKISILLLQNGQTSCLEESPEVAGHAVSQIFSSIFFANILAPQASKESKYLMSHSKYGAGKYLSGCLKISSTVSLDISPF